MGTITSIGNQLVDWSSKRQNIYTHSTAEDEYVAADPATRILIQFRAIEDEQLEPTVLHEDNMACLSLAKGEGNVLTSKHIVLRYHYMRQLVIMNEIKLVDIPTDEELADKLTKTLAFRKFNELMKKIVAKVHDDEDNGLAHERVNVE